MNVGLDITQAVKRKVRGIARYIREVLPHLLNHESDGDTSFSPVLYVRAERVFVRGPLRELSRGHETRWLPLQFYLPGRGLDLFHSFGNHLPTHSPVLRTFTIHDCRVLDTDTDLNHGRLQNNVERSDGILCLTEHGRSRILHHFPAYDPDRIAVVPHGVDHNEFRPRSAEAAREAAKRHGLNRPFLLQLGSWFPHKNLELSIRAYAISRARRENIRLAFVGGGASHEHRTQLHALCDSLGISNMIDWVEDVPANDIPALLSASCCLLQPSRYEGFALPLLEAMATGTPGVVSDSTCLPEVSGGVWPVAGVDDAEAFAAAADEMALDEERRAAVIQAGVEHAANYRWEETARKTVDFFSRMVKMGSRDKPGS